MTRYFKSAIKINFIFAAVMISLMFVTGATMALIWPLSQDKQQFEVKFTITYNSITLSEAAMLEEKIKKEYDDACSVDIKVNEPASGTISIGNWNDEGIIYPMNSTTDSTIFKIKDRQDD